MESRKTGEVFIVETLKDNGEVVERNEFGDRDQAERSYYGAVDGIGSASRVVQGVRMIVVWNGMQLIIGRHYNGMRRSKICW